MYKCYLILLVTGFISASELFDVNEAPVVGEAYLYVDRPIYAGSDTEYYAKAFNISVKPSDLLARVIVALKDSKSSNLCRKQKDFLQQFDQGFHEYLPFNLFKDKNENDIIKLAFYGKIVHLVCKISPIANSLASRNIHFLPDLYKHMFLLTLERPNYQSKDLGLLEKAQVLTHNYEDEYSHGFEGFGSLITHCPKDCLPQLGQTCKKTTDLQLKHLEQLARTTTNQTKFERLPGVIDMLVSVGKNVQCMQTIIERQHIVSKWSLESSN